MELRPVGATIMWGWPLPPAEARGYRDCVLSGRFIVYIIAYKVAIANIKVTIANIIFQN